MSEPHDRPDAPVPDAPIADASMPEASPPDAPTPIRGLRAMAAVRWAILLATFALAAGTWWTQVLAPEPAAVGDARFYCPMHPQITSPVPGTCPICSMRLEPIPDDPMGGAHDHDHGDHASVADAGAPPLEVGPVMLTTERRQLAGIASVPVRRASAGGALRIPATVRAREASISEVRTRVPAFVERAAVRETGVQVRAGQPLAWVYAPEIVQAQEELLVASRWSASGAQTAEGDALRERARERLRLLGVGERDLDAIVASGRSTRTVPLRAPASGWVTERRAVVGAYATPDEPLYVIADLARVWVVASAFADQLGALPETGARATFHPRAGAPVEVTLERVVPTVESEARTIEVRFVAENPVRAGQSLTLLPGAIGELALELPRSDALVVPRDAVIDTGARRHVFVEREGGLFEPREVVLGALSGDDRVIIGGLEEGERVVARGTFVLDSESRLSSALAPRVTDAGVP